jgi:hypothetical protein
MKILCLLNLNECIIAKPYDFVIAIIFETNSAIKIVRLAYALVTKEKLSTYVNRLERFHSSLYFAFAKKTCLFNCDEVGA